MVARLMLLALLACSGCKRGAAQGPQEISLQLFGDPAELDAYREMIAAFEEQHPGIRVKLIPVGKQKEFMAKLTTAFSGGTPPDVFLVNYRRYGQLAERGVLEPLGDHLGRGLEVKLEALYPQPVEAFRYRGKLQCLPQNVSSLVVYFNRALFEARGVPLPKEGWTWAELLAAGKALTDRSAPNPSDHVHGIGFEPTLVRLAPFVWQAGGEMVDDLEHPTRFRLESPAGISALKFILELRRVHAVTPSLEEAAALDLEARFIRGKLGMLFQSRRFTPTARAAGGLDWDVAPLPVGKQAATLLHADAYCVARDSAHKEAAFRFISFALGPDGAERIARSGRTVPSLRSVAESEAFLDPTQRPASSRAFLDALPLLRRLPSTATWNEIEMRSDPVVEEWYYGPDRTGLGMAASGADDGGVRFFPGSAKAAMRTGDELTVLPRELTEAVRGLWSPRAP